MCLPPSTPATTAAPLLELPSGSPLVPLEAASNNGVSPRGSRRKRIWELDTFAHCMVVGVCLPIAALRKVVDKALGGTAIADDYQLHCGAVGDCRHRNAVAEAVQRELDRRYALDVQKALRLKSEEALAAAWDEAMRARAIAGPLWSVLTHPRCGDALARRIEGEVHMLQHQVGMADRVEHEQLRALHEKHAALGRELARTRQRCQRETDEHTRRVAALQVSVRQMSTPGASQHCRASLRCRRRNSWASGPRPPSRAHGCRRSKRPPRSCATVSSSRTS